MKLLKITILTLILAISTSTIAAKADFDIYVYQEIKAGSTNKTPSYKKRDVSNQTYSHSTSETALTRPCRKCKISVQGVSKNYGTTNTVTTIMGDTKMLSNSGYEDTYYLKLKRVDATALTTKTGGTWHIET